MPNNTNRLGLPYILQSQSQKEVTHNDGLNLLDAMVQAVVQQVSLNTPPASPTLGNCYIVGGAPTGAWVGNSNKIAQAIIGGWLFIPAFNGLSAFNIADGNVYRYDGTNWSSTAISSLQNLSMLGINASADATNKLTVASSAILFNHIGNGIQVKLNKNAVGDSASFLFQSNWSARAEFGLLGDDNFTLKVSPNGSTFFDSLKMLAASGRVALKSNGSALSAAGTTQATATAITKQTNQFTTVAAGTGAVLPSPEQGEVTKHVIEWRGKPCYEIGRAFRNHAREVNLGWITPHVLRHTGATLMVQNGVSMWEIAGIMGDKLETVEKHYLKHHPDYLKDATSALDRIYA